MRTEMENYKIETVCSCTMEAGPTSDPIEVQSDWKTTVPVGWYGEGNKKKRFEMDFA